MMLNNNTLIIDKKYYFDFIELCKVLYHQYDNCNELLNNGTMLISCDNKIFIIFQKNDEKHVIFIDGSIDILEALLKFKYIGDSYSTPYPVDDNDKNVTEIDQYLIFKSLSKIFLDKNNLSYKLIDNCLVDNNNNIIQATINSNVISNENIQSIQPKAFFALDIKQLQITSNIKNIKHNAFYCCFSLEKVTLPNSILEIGEDCFNQCISLKSINIPTSITKILKNTFRYCQSLEYLNIGQQITYIDIAFKHCNNIKQLCNVNKKCILNNHLINNNISLKDIIQYGNS